MKRPSSSEIGSHSKAIKRLKVSRNEHALKDAMIDVDLGVNSLFATMDQQLLADYLAKQTSLLCKNLSKLEVEDRRIPGITNPRS